MAAAVRMARLTLRPRPACPRGRVRPSSTSFSRATSAYSTGARNTEISEARDQSADDDDREGLLGVAADAGRHRRGQQTKTSDERRHQNRTQADEGSFVRGLKDVFCPSRRELVDERIQDHARLDAHAHERDETEPGRDAEVCAGQLEGQQTADRLGHENAEENDGREFQVAVEREQY